MFHTPWMYRGRELRRSRKETNQHKSATRNRSASEAAGSMSSDCVGGAVENDEGLWSRDLDSSMIGGRSRSVPSSGLHKRVESTVSFQKRVKSCSEDNRTLESSSHFAVLDVEESQAASEGLHEENVETDGNSLRRSSKSGSPGSTEQPLQNSLLVEESEDLIASESNSEMGNTHWSHSYTGVRQPVRMRSSCRTDSAKLIEDLSDVYVPIIGYEMMEQRAKFTVFKLHVQKNSKESWFIFRRYTDFERLNGQLSYLFPNFRLALPPKKWFGNNFDPVFLEDRQLGLQAFLNNICGHKDIVVSDCVREFLCVDDPPGPHDSLEESRALCESLEETVYHLKKDLADRERKISTLTEELANSMRRIEALTIQQINCNNRVLPLSPNGSDTTDVDRRSCAEADQQDYSPDQEEGPLVPSFSDGNLKPVSEAVPTQPETPPEFTTIPLDTPTPNTKDAPIISSSEVIQVT